MEERIQQQLRDPGCAHGPEKLLAFHFIKEINLSNMLIHFPLNADSLQDCLKASSDLVEEFLAEVGLLISDLLS